MTSNDDDLPPEPGEEDFLDRLGSENDPVQRFKNAIEACGSKFTETESGWLRIEKPCENLRVIEKPSFIQLLCDECGVSALVEMRAGEATEEEPQDEASEQDAEIDEFFDRMGDPNWEE